MFANPVEKIEDFFVDTLSGWVQNSLIRASETISDCVGIMSGDITKTPQEWNNTVFTAIKSISDAAILPIATAIMAIIICYDMVTVCIDKNNFKEFDTSIFFRIAIKGFVAIYFLNNAFTIVGAFFEIGSDMADIALKQLFTEETKIQMTLTSTEFTEILKNCELGDLILTGLLSLLVYIISVAVIVIVMIVTAGRMIEMLIYFCVAPLPFATVTNKEWNNIGFSYIKNILALALQAFFIVITLAIYITLFNANVTNLTTDFASLSGALFNWICYSVVCCFMLLKTGSVAKSICNAH